ncbi:hypothetical protein BROSI_A1751 [Candidatus Brocadia sinica JPN1]|uniref:Uncharacterized protein n=1 Tax=Candidatus Brocadia sinica JPN1 TaxID=1197129 RepID=A0ABQ0JWT2_9BACT|nr:hypothetical protein BROSI_A1751 [Candidatus Brocadia sinica JPN1]
MIVVTGWKENLTVVGCFRTRYYTFVFFAFLWFNIHKIAMNIFTFSGGK